MEFNFTEAKNIGLFKSYTQLQVDSINAIIYECNKQNITLKPQVAYILATGYHEGYDYDGKTTGKVQRLVPIKEKGSLAYLKSKPYYPNIGYGFVQITWLDNYKKMKPHVMERFGVDIVANPELLLREDIAAFVIVFGMKHAMFTKYKLDDFINTDSTDFKGARKIVNPGDHKTYNTIAAYANDFSQCL